MHATIPAAVLRRTYDVSPERMFEMWTTPEIAKQFLGPNEVEVPQVEMDVRTGGSYRIHMKMDDGEVWIVKGTYHEVRAPHLLKMTWVWEEGRAEDEHETLLTLEFNPHEGGTELVLTHEQFATEESRAGHSRGWAEILDAVAAVAR